MSDLRAALEHYDERIDPDRSTGEMSAREWRDAYFTLARIALKELEKAWAALAAPAEGTIMDLLGRKVEAGELGSLDLAAPAPSAAPLRAADVDEALRKLKSIASVAHLAWLDPPTVQSAFRAIERLAQEVRAALVPEREAE